MVWVVMASVQKDRGAPGSQTIERGLRALRLIAGEDEGLSVTEIATALGTHRAGVYRLLAPLVNERLVQRDGDGRYRLGLGLLELASRVRADLQEVAVRELRALADDLRATTALTLRDEDEAVVAAVVEPRSTDMHIAYRPGLRHRLNQAAPGMAILSALPPRPRERAAIKEARERGWAFSTGELLPGATGVAVPIVVPGRDVASISAVWIEPRDEVAAAERVMETAAVITAALR